MFVLGPKLLSLIKISLNQKNVDSWLHPVFAMTVESAMNREFCTAVDSTPSGAHIRRWTLRDDNHGHHHGVVSLSKSPLYLDPSWRRTASDPLKKVGTFRLDLAELLPDGYIRYDPLGSSGPHVRLRIVRADGHFYVQVNDLGPRVLLA